jgi:hypothetical protein
MRMIHRVGLESYKYDTFFGVLILLNMLIIGMELELGDGFPEGVQNPFWWIETAFLIAFIVELVIRIKVQRFWLVGSNEKKEIPWDGRTDCIVECVDNKYQGNNPLFQCFGWLHAYTGTEHFGHHMWLIFDFSIILLSAVDVWIFSVQSEGEGHGGGNVSSLRVLRLARVLRSVKLLRYFKDLYLLMNGLARAFKTINWVMLLLGLVIYVCAMFMTNLIGRNE